MARNDSAPGETATPTVAVTDEPAAVTTAAPAVNNMFATAPTDVVSAAYPLAVTTASSWATTPERDEQPNVYTFPETGSTASDHIFIVVEGGMATLLTSVPFDATTPTSVCAPAGHVAHTT